MSIIEINRLMHTLTTRLRLFAHEHDDVPAFHATYLIATFLVAAVFSLGYFAILIALHMALDYVKYRDYFHFGYLLTLKAMLLESVVDIALLFLSLTFAVYLSHDLALAMVSGLLRSALTIVRAIGTILPKIEIFEHLLSVVLNLHTYMYAPHANIGKRLSFVHRLSFLTIATTALLLVSSFIIFHGQLESLLAIYSRELTLKL